MEIIIIRIIECTLIGIIFIDILRIYAGHESKVIPFVLKLFGIKELSDKK